MVKLNILLITDLHCKVTIHLMKMKETKAMLKNIK